MSSSNIEDIIGSLYDMVQDARTMPLAADKCILERDRVLDMLDEVIAQMPGELKQARTIVESRNDLINQARREAEGVLRPSWSPRRPSMRRPGSAARSWWPRPRTASISCARRATNIWTPS